MSGTRPAPESNTGGKTRAITGKDWNEMVGTLKRITPRGDGETTQAVATKDGTRILATPDPSGDPGGASFADLPPLAKTDGPSVISGETWNKLIDYLNQIKPLEFPNVADVADVTTEEAGCDPGTFYLNVTLTGGTYPFEWMGVEWTASGQTKAVCGAGTQQDSSVSTFYGTPIYTFAGSQTWVNSTTATGSIRLDVGGAGKGYVNPKIYAKKTGTPSPFVFNLGVGGFTFLTYGTTTALTTSNLSGYTPAPASLLSQATSSRITQIMMGSCTLTSGRVISWAPVPALPWDYDNPPA